MSVIITGAKMPKNCHECGALGYSDIVGVNCPSYCFEKRPEACQLKTVEGLIEKIEAYENDCSLSCPNNDDCRDCNETMFKSIYHIIDKHTNREGRND